MAQNYTEIQDTATLQNSRALLLNNDKTAISQSSGSTFPSTNLQLGMSCYRTDQDMVYILTSTGPSVWTRQAAGSLFNDAAGSGTLNASEFLRSNTADTASGTISFSAGFNHFSHSSTQVLFSATNNRAHGRITVRDGSGDFNIRGGCYNSNGDKYANNGDGATHIRSDFRGTNGRITMRVAIPGNQDNNITFANTLTLDALLGLRYNGNSVITTGSTVAVPNATQWAGAVRTVTTGTPSGGSDGDIHFQREA